MALSNTHPSHLEVRLVGHACVILKYRDTSIILDPWFGFPFNFDAFHPHPEFGPPSEKELSEIGAIHISHMHSDHFCKRSLAFFRREIPVYIAFHKDQKFVTALKNMGFTDVREIFHGNLGVAFGDLRLHAFVAERTFPYDSSLVVDAGGEAFVFDNDARFGMWHYFALSRYFKKVGGVCAGFSDIWPFPTCFDFSECTNGGGSDFKESYMRFAEEEAWRKIEGICEQLNPSWIFPYASGLRFKHSDTIHHNGLFFDENKVFDRKLGASKPVLLLPGDSIVDNQIRKVTNRQPIRDEPTMSLLADASIKCSDIASQSGLLISNYMAALQTEVSRWSIPMTIRINIRDCDLDEIRFDFRFDGSSIAVSEVDRPDLEITYPADGIQRFLDKSWTFESLHYCYRYTVKVHRLVAGQISVHRW